MGGGLNWERIQLQQEKYNHLNWNKANEETYEIMPHPRLDFSSNH